VSKADGYRMYFWNSAIIYVLSTMFGCHHSVAHTQDKHKGDSLHIWRVAAKALHRHLELTSGVLQLG